MNYCEEKGISTSKLNEAQKTLYFIAENMKMDKSISEEGYEHFQQAIKALEQEPILDKIYADIQKLRGCSCSCSDGIIDDVEDILDKYKAESEDAEAHPINENITKGFEEFTKMMFRQGQAESEK